jgi:hypothetical protein
LGSLQYDRNERLVFETEVQENLLLDAFGLEGFQFPQIRHSEFIHTKRPYVDKEAVRPIFSKRRVKTLAIGIPIILALLIIPASRSSWKNYSFINNQASSTAAIELMAPSSPVASTPSTSLETKASSPLSAVQIKRANPSTASTHVSSEEKYHLIGGCFRIKENADNLFNQLRERGYKSELNQLPNGNYLVTVQSYAGWDDARLALNKLREEEPQAGYWILVK